MIPNVILGETIQPEWGNAVADELNEATDDIATIEAALAVITANGWVVTARIGDAQVTNAKVASGLDAAKLTTGTLPIARIADGAVTNAKLATGIDASKLTTGTLPIARIADLAVTNAKIANATIAEAKLATAVLSSSWTVVTPASGWSTGTLQGRYSLRYKRTGNIIYLSGAIRATGNFSSNALLCTLPTGFRPGADVEIAVVSAPPSLAPSLSILFFQDNGEIEATFGGASNHIYTINAAIPAA